MKAVLKKFMLPLIDAVISPFVFMGAFLFRFVRKHITGLPLSKKILFSVGVFPIRDHYYEPMFNTRHLRHSLRDDRELPGIDFNDSLQLEILRSFSYNDELAAIPTEKPSGGSREYYYNCGAYCSGDGEYLYSMVRKFRPSRIIEVGSGFSTLMINNAISRNVQECGGYSCVHECIEPYEQPWLETLPVKVIRSRLEDVDREIFRELGKNDMLIIDSSHIIRPQGDVVTEYLEILPVLTSGVIVHVHDIFTPKDYLDSWLYDDVRLWNEQYLLEAFMTFNSEFEILGALNYLTHHYYNELAEKFPVFSRQPGREPGAFWIRRK
ncbi:MAG: class I SAM-dependent methyltransferase [Synergistaceae bacterium]|nr:class I SAM-dependent methyltransferase [Synergistaceae bacterium]